MSFRICQGAAEVHHRDGQVEIVDVDIVRDGRGWIGVRIMDGGPLHGITVLVDPAWFEHAKAGRTLADLRVE